MKIASVRVTPIAIKDPPLLNASGIHEPYALRSIIEIESTCGRCGLGETYGDSVVLSDLLNIAPQLSGISLYDLNGVKTVVLAACASDTASSVTRSSTALASTLLDKRAAKAYAAFEVALWDLQSQRANAPLVDALGGAVRTSVDYSAYLFFKYAEHIDTPYAADPWGVALDADQIVSQARSMISQYGFGSIKLKAGALAPDAEADCLLALKREFPAHPLRIDPNANWSLPTAVRIAERLGTALEYYEDPTPGLDGMAALHKTTGLALATNMVVTSFDELRRSIPINAVQIVLSDHHFWGGLRATQQLAAMCEVFGIGVSMHSNSHLGISLMAMTHLAAAIPNVAYACDTHYPWQSEEVIAGDRVQIKNGKVEVPRTAGLGVTLDRERLRTLHEQFLSCGIKTRNDNAQMRRYQPDFPKVKPRY
jgi:glucarate dehydratase